MFFFYELALIISSKSLSKRQIFVLKYPIVFVVLVLHFLSQLDLISSSSIFSKQFILHEPALTALSGTDRSKGKNIANGEILGKLQKAILHKHSSHSIGCICLKPNIHRRIVCSRIKSDVTAILAQNQKNSNWPEKRASGSSRVPCSFPGCRIQGSYGNPVPMVDDRVTLGFNRTSYVTKEKFCRYINIFENIILSAH